MAVTLGTFVGGIGLFLLGMHLMTEGLRVAAGGALRDILSRATGTRLRALASGALITGLVQSSSAVTIAVIGFVNAGLLDLSRAVWVVFGANVGTTMTGWLVAITGLELDLAAYALPGIGVGTLLSTFGKNRRMGAVGQTVAGFGLFFLGLSFLKTAFGEVATTVDPASLDPGGVGGVLLFAAVGLVLTAATQSSSASLAIALAAADSGLIPLMAAGAWVIGANLGTTSTALISVMGATANARRTAMAHVAFNVLAAAAAFLLLPVAFHGLAALLGLFDMSAGAAIQLAIFHTAFNLIGVLLVWPLSGRLTTFLETRFVGSDEEIHVLHLDTNVLAVPAVAIEALQLESRRVLALAANAVVAACADAGPEEKALDRHLRQARFLSEEIGGFFTQLDRSSMNAEVAEALRRLIRVAHHTNIVLEQAAQVAEIRARPTADERGSADVPLLLGAVREIAAAAGDPSVDAAALRSQLRKLNARYKEANVTWASTAATGARATTQALYRQQVASEARRAAKHVVRAAEGLAGVETVIEPSETAEPSSAPHAESEPSEGATSESGTFDAD